MFKIANELCLGNRFYPDLKHMGEPYARKDSMAWLVKLFGITLPPPPPSNGTNNVVENSKLNANSEVSAEVKGKKLASAGTKAEEGAVVVPYVNGHVNGHGP